MGSYMSSVYLLHAYGGPRLGGEHPDYMADRTLYLSTHLSQLQKLNHNIDHIILSINTFEDEPIEFRDLVSDISKTDIEIHRRPNIGVSYGAWSELFSKYADNFDYFFTMEDDYLYVEDNFDQTMIDMFHENEDTAFLCGIVGTGHGSDDVHAGSSNGITTGEVIRKCLQHGRFPHSGVKHDYNNWSFGQVKWSQHFFHAGKIRDITHKYAIPFAYNGQVRWYYCIENDYKVLQVPFQYFKENYDIRL
jgi:hypothetical protein